MTNPGDKAAPSILHKDEEPVFSIPFHMIPISQELKFDLYGNFSIDGSANKFMKVLPIGEKLEPQDLKEFQEKYGRLYVLESQRGSYLKTMANSDKLSSEEKTTFLKNSAIDYLDKVFNPQAEFNNELLSDTINQCYEAVDAMVDVVQDFNVEALQGHIANLSFHDFYTYDHSINVSMYCISFFHFLEPKADRSLMALVGLGGMLHDLGKVQIPTAIINKPGNLSKEEFETMKKHPDFGIALLNDNNVSVAPEINIELLKRVVWEHHENWDGTGYPRKLQGKDIHPLARLTAICDFFDAVTTRRAYNSVVNTSQALDIMSKTVGKKLDPVLFESFCKHCGKSKPTGRSVSTIADDFDPCSPHRGLPLKGVSIKK